jgi:hypothetical protein
MMAEPSIGVLRAVARKAGLSIEQISPELRVFQDLGIGGDDAAELFDELAREYQIDFSRFDFSGHFPSEPNLVSIFKRQKPKKELTVAALIQAASAGRLIG